MRFIVGDTVSIKSNCDFYVTMTPSFMYEYVPRLAHAYKVFYVPDVNGKQFVVVSRTAYSWMYIVQEVDSGRIFVANPRSFKLLRERDDIIISN